MQILKITERLEAMARLAAGAEVLADIGTDHGYLPIHMLQNGLIKSAILTDVNEWPLDNARRTLGLVGGGLWDKTDLRLEDGLAPLSVGEADTIVIAGMGGELISDILAAAPEKAASAKKLVLQPRTRSGELRKFLFMNQYFILTEEIVMENGHLCEIIVASKEDFGGDAKRYEIVSAEDADNVELKQFLTSEIGSRLLAIRPPLFSSFIEHKIDVQKKIAAEAQKGGASDTAELALAKVEALLAL
ncbi:MAG: class I SAM-dependent methyltransferase [Clostridiales Family XIII bacterium]|jgi:tRNA (adenine22-N1)-methyltransferase|nr:class I SAM-dependent methyltransferase [Clostridiales Family XIII bacterium]